MAINKTHSSYKSLLYTNYITMEAIWEDMQEVYGMKNTGIYFNSKNNEPLRIKAHLTLPAITSIKEDLEKKYGDNAKTIFKELLLILNKLTRENTALLSVYIPKTYLSKSVKDVIESDNN